MRFELHTWRCMCVVSHISSISNIISNCLSKSGLKLEEKYFIYLTLVKVA